VKEGRGGKEGQWQLKYREGRERRERKEGRREREKDREGKKH
jgi:hypothetical protein